MNKEELIEKIKQLADLTNDEKSELIGGLRKKKYGLVWENHPEEVEERLRTQLPVLVEDKSKQIASDSEDAPNHILIEGDNLEALTALTYTHEGKIDVIYIDPPYNTGNKDFVYNDSYVDSEDGYRHSKWLSFMEKRLRIAKKLLSDKGVIFLSIDNNEYAQLKLLCDEIFLEKNFVEMLKWKRKKQPSFLARHTAAVMEYILIYANDYYELEKLSIEGASDATKKILNISNNESQRHFNAGVRIKIEGKGRLNAGEYTNKTLSINLLNDLHFANGRTLNEVDLIGKFADSQERITKFIEEDLLFFTANKGLRRDVSEEEKGKRKSITDLLLDWGDNQDSENELKDIFGITPFDYAKPSKLIHNLIKSFYSNNSLILDFFAGSGTTLHATMQLNKEDGGHRQCILVTNNENGICENVTYERNKRVINGYTTPKGEHVEGLHGNNLRYYKVDFVPREDTVANRLALMQKATDLLCIKHDLYDEQKQFGTLQLKSRYVRYFSNEEQQMLVVYEPRAIAAIVKELRQNPALATKERKLTVYAYSDGAYAYNDEFEGLEAVVGLVALPDALNQAIRNILPSPIADTTLFEEGDEA